MLHEIDVSEDKRHSDWRCQEGKCNREKKGLGNGRCFFARDGIEEPEDSTRIRTGRLIRTGCLTGCGFGSRND